MPSWKVNFCWGISRLSVFPRSLLGEIADCHVVGRVVREVEITRNCFRRIFVFFFFQHR